VRARIGGVSEAGARLARAAGAAALSTLSALGLHALAGGHVPTAAAVLVPLAGSFSVAAQLAGRPLGRLRLAVVAVASQVFFHATFTLGAGEPLAAGSAPASAAGHAGHAAHAAPSLVSTTAGDHAASMPLAHLGAAVITYVGIRRAATLIDALGSLAALVADALAAALLARPAAARTMPVAARRCIVPSHVPAPARRVVLTLPARRGPPLPV